MLQVVRIKHPNQKQEWLDRFQPETESWLVSDLRSKYEIQQKLLQSRPGYEDWTIYRASELWRLLLRRARPELQLIPRDFALSWLTDVLRRDRKSSQNKLIQPQSAKTLLGVMDLFAPLFSHPTGAQILREFFEAEPVAAERFGVWATLAQHYYAQFAEQNWALPSWVPAILTNEPRLLEFWDRPLWVDLGVELRQSEVEILKRLSSAVSVTVLVPEVVSEEKYRFLLEPSLVLARENKVLTSVPVPSTAGTRTALRFSSPLAEVKHVISEVRQWAEAGILLSQMAVIAPDIEAYWPLLEPFLDYEGLPTQKDSVARLQSWPHVGKFLARLRLRAGQVSFADSEQGLFEAGLQVRFEKFQSFFKQALALEDLQKEKTLQGFFMLGLAPGEEVNLEEFMSWAARDWPDETNWEPFEMFLKDLLLMVPLDIRMHVDSWISYLESLAAKKEIRVRPGSRAGLALLNLMEAEGLHFRKRIFLGLSESNFKKKTNPLLSTRDLQRLGWDFGFFLDHPEQNILNFELEWSLLIESEDTQLCFPATGFSNQAEAPHPIWIQQGGGEKAHRPGFTRWDEIQNSNLPLSDKMKRDLGQIEVAPLSLTEAPSFSASSIERFRNCAFQFAAERWFNLLDLPERDMDLDARSKGSLTHKLFERLTAPPRRFDWTDEELSALAEEIRLELELEHRDGLFWKIDKARAISLAKRFLDFEKNWFEKFPQVEIEARELRFEFYYDPIAKTFHPEALDGRLKFKGALDRVEHHPAGYKTLVDYKPSWDQKRAYNSWVRDNFLQLAIYAWAMDRGLIQGLKPGVVTGIETYTYQPLRRGRGFVAPEAVGLSAEKAAPKDKTLADKEALYQDLERLLIELFDLILMGKITPMPLNGEHGDFSICDSCRWSEVCRAPHLNS